MFAYLKGILTSSHPSQVILDVNGIGYILFIPCRVFGELPLLGQAIQFYTSFVVREFSHAIYGFLSSQERDIFEVLMNITGVGPKLALSLIGHLSFDELQLAVINHDLPTLCRVPGVGKKTAERLIVELKDKLPSFAAIQPDAKAFPNAKEVKGKHMQDAMLALINLGYNQMTAQKAIKQGMNDLPEDPDLVSLITAALKNI